MEQFKFKKKFGQNFLVDKNIVKKIVTDINKKESSLVIEIGCGDGKLTQELCQNFDYVLGYEIDLEVKERLLNNLNKYENKNIIFDDFLNRKIKEDIDIKKYKNIYIIANLPYYITTPIIEKIIQEKIEIKEMRLMVQKEVGDRLTALPKTKNYGSLTVYLNYYFEVKKLFVVGRNCFMPRPNVDSIIVSFKLKEKQNVRNEDIFFKLIRDSFKFKRKTIRNNLKDYNLDIISNVLEKHNMSLMTRAEEIPLEIFIEIANEL